MRKFMWFAALALTATPAGTWAQSPAAASQDKPATANSTQPASAQPQTESLADAARKAREQKKGSKPAKVFTNDDLPKAGGISTVGATGVNGPSDQNASSQ